MLAESEGDAGSDAGPGLGIGVEAVESDVGDWHPASRLASTAAVTNPRLSIRPWWSRSAAGATSGRHGCLQQRGDQLAGSRQVSTLHDVGEASARLVGGAWPVTITAGV